MARRKYSTTEGTVYTGKKTHRRVVAVFTHAERGLRIVYSEGGDSNRECGYVAFRRWATRTGARKAIPTRVPKLTLRAAA